MNIKFAYIKKILLSCLIVLLSANLFAQTKVVQTGAIRFEKKVNLHKVIAGIGGDNARLAELSKRFPKYLVTNYDLYFNGNESIFKYAKDQPEDKSPPFGMNRQDESNNVVYKNLDSNTIIANKQVFDQLMLIEDKLRQAEWHLSNTYRKIADYNCRRATTIILDSLYVIAFYTDAITTQSGPEGFSGLPGMIMGIVIPRLNVTYFATSVDLQKDMLREIEPPKKGKKTDYAKLEATITEAVKTFNSWGRSRERIWSYLY